MAQFPGASELAAALRTDGVVHFRLDYSDPKATYTIPVKKGYIVKEVATNVITAFNATSPSLAVQDGDASNGYLQNSDVALGTAATGSTPAVKNSTAIANAFQHGKTYQADDTIDFVFDPGTGGTAGELVGYVRFSNLYNDGITL